MADRTSFFVAFNEVRFAHDVARAYSKEGNVLATYRAATYGASQALKAKGLANYIGDQDDEIRGFLDRIDRMISRLDTMIEIANVTREISDLNPPTIH